MRLKLNTSPPGNANTNESTAYFTFTTQEHYGSMKQCWLLIYP
ncbi:Uncharacterised protein [Legionella hackeliae]|nr:Uncharacterised protein [Legionella hackeliae]